jgi:hypothetical protein
VAKVKHDDAMDAFEIDPISPPMPGTRARTVHETPPWMIALHIVKSAVLCWPIMHFKANGESRTTSLPKASSIAKVFADHYMLNSPSHHKGQ